MSGNNVGGIVGYYSSAGNDVSFVDTSAVAVSEPGSLLILLAGLVGIAVLKSSKWAKFGALRISRGSQLQTRS